MAGGCGTSDEIQENGPGTTLSTVSPTPINRIIGRGASVALVAKVAAKAAAFLMALILARHLSVEAYGTFVLVSTWLLLLMILGVVGLDNAAMRFVAQYREEENGAAKVQMFVRWAGRRVLVFSCVVALIAVPVIWFLADARSVIAGSILAIAAATLPLLAYSHFAQFALRGMRHVGRAEAVGQIIRPVAVIVIAVALSYAGVELNTTLAIAGLMVGTVLSTMAGAYWLRSSISSRADSIATPEQARNWTRTAFPMMLITTSHFLLHQLDVLMLGSIVGTSSVASYAVASRLADVVAFALAVASSIVAPMIASLYHSGRKEELQEMLHTAGRWVTLAALVVAAILVLGPVDFLALFGDAYTAAYTVLIILVFGQLLSTFAGPVGFLLSMTGRQKESAGILASGVVINAILNIVLIPQYAELGAAVATAATTIYWNIAMTVFASRKLGLRATPI